MDTRRPATRPTRSTVHASGILGVGLGLALLLGGCGGEEEPAEPPSSTTTSAEATEVEATTDEADEAPAVPDEAAAEAAVQAYFDAMRAGDAAAVCALESEDYQVFRYGETGQACLDDLGNGTEQLVWADPVVVVSLEVDGVGATAVLQPNAGSDAQATMTLQATDGEWRVFSFS